MRVAPRSLRLALAGCLALACSGAPKDPGIDEIRARLGDCPPGDAAWRTLLDHPAATDDTAAVRRTLAGLQETCPDRWEPAWALAESLMREDRAADAVPHLETALGRAERSADPAGVALARNGLGWSAYVEGRYDDAESLYGEALAAARRAGRDDVAGFVHNNLAGVLNDRGRFAEARDQLEQAEVRLAAAGRDEVVPGLAHNRAVILMELGNAAAARRLLERNHAAGDAWLADASAVVLGNLHLALDEPAVARSWFQRVGEAHERLALRARLGEGVALLRGGEAESAAAALDALGAPAREADRHLGFLVELFQAEAWLRRGEPDRAGRMLARLLEEGEEIGAGDAGWAAGWMLARARRAESRDDAAIPLLRDALVRLEAQSTALDPFGQGLYFLRGRSEPFVELADALAATGDPTHQVEIWDVANRARARALGRSLVGAEPTGGAAEPATVRAALRPDEVLLSYLIGDDRGLLLAVTRRELRIARIPGRRVFLEDFHRYLAALRGGDPAAKSGRRLRAALLGPVEDRLTAGSTAYVVPDRELALLPFAALPSADGTGFVGDDVDVAVLPLAAPPPRGSGDRRAVFLGGAPIFRDGAGFDELPWSGFELSGLQELWADRSPRVVHGDGFTREALGELATTRFDLVHLATHAVASTRDPRECGVILSGGDRLGLDDIVGLELEGSLVVLSACRTGEGELVPGEGVVGLGWAFLRAGAGGIVVSRWSAEDRASARLMLEFHRGLRAGTGPVRALAEARRALAREGRHPADWALYDLVLRPGEGPGKQ